MKYLVTGGAGFIGSHLIDLLLKSEHQIIIVDDLSSGKKENLLHTLNSVQFIEQKIQLTNIQELKSIDGIFHLAAQASVPLSKEHFFESSKNNLESTIKVIDFARKLKVPLVYATSSAIYGGLSCGDDQIENYDIESPYALDKLVLEQYAQIANRIYGLSSIGLRFFNVYGERQDPSNPYSGVISIFADRMLNQQSITVNGGYQTRDFVYVKDVVKTLYNSMLIASKKKCCDNINVGTGISISINTLVQILSDIIGRKARIDYKKLPQGDPEISKGMFNKLSQVLGIKTNNFLSLEEGLQATLIFIKE
jgi:UDP-glucose 4-epimerase